MDRSGARRDDQADGQQLDGSEGLAEYEVPGERGDAGTEVEA